MKTGNNGLALIKHFEGLSLKAYKDVAGFWTIGYGHLLKAPCPPITQEQADALLKLDLFKAEQAVSRLIAVPLSQGQFDALVSFTFNLGAARLKASTLRQKLNRGDYQGAALEIPKWRMAGGRVVAGLVRRRQAEKELYESDSDPVATKRLHTLPSRIMDAIAAR